MALNIRKAEIYAGILFTAECAYSDRKGGGGGGFDVPKSKDPGYEVHELVGSVTQF